MAAMKNAGRGILWFLGACLAMTQGTVALLARSDGPPETSLLLFAGGALAAVLAVLLLMFFHNPLMVTAQSQVERIMAATEQLYSTLGSERAGDVIKRLPLGELIEGVPEAPIEGEDQDDPLPGADAAEENDDDAGVDDAAALEAIDRSYRPATNPSARRNAP